MAQTVECLPSKLEAFQSPSAARRRRRRRKRRRKEIHLSGFYIHFLFEN
jgi:hypothetical protein